jgi:hypothetical protein
MITARDAFYYSLVVRRVSTGSTPFRWEVHRAVGIELAQVSSERFRTMQAAYEAGQAWLTAFLALPVSDALRSTTLSADDDDDAFSDQDEDIDPAPDALGEGFIGTAAPVYPSSIG